MPSRVHAMEQPAGLGRRRGARTERNAEPVEGVHQPDRVGEVGQFLAVELGRGGFVVGIGNTGLGHAGSLRRLDA